MPISKKNKRLLGADEEQFLENKKRIQEHLTRGKRYIVAVTVSNDIKELLTNWLQEDGYETDWLPRIVEECRTFDLKISDISAL